MDVNKKTPKEIVSDMNMDFLVGCEEHGLYYFPISTGGGKSYSMVQYVCSRGFKKFDRCVVVIPQIKLASQIKEDFDKVIQERAQGQGGLKKDGILVVENNREIMRKAFEGAEDAKPIDRLLKEMERAAAESSKQRRTAGAGKEKGSGGNNLKPALDMVRRAKNEYEKLLAGQRASAEIESKEEEAENRLRFAVKSFFKDLRRGSAVRLSRVLQRFPSLPEVFPQVEIRKKKAIILTSMKLVYGIDTILGKNVDAGNIMEMPGKTMMFLDEADLIFEDWIKFIIESAVGFRRDGVFRKPLSGYDLFLRLHDMIRMSNLPARYNGIDLHKSLDDAVKREEKIWSEQVGGKPLVTILPQDSTSLEEYRKGTFFCGYGRSVSVSPSKDKTRQYVCRKAGDDFYTIVHSALGVEKVKQEHGFEMVVPVNRFLHAARMCVSAIFHAFYGVIYKSLETNKKRYAQSLKDLRESGCADDYYLGEPTLSSEIHSFIKNFGDNNDNPDMELHMIRFMTTRKRLEFPDESGNPAQVRDRSVYALGVQLYDEKVDLEDFQKRIALRCREIPTSPEAIILSIVRSGSASVILSSATCLSRSVTRNFCVRHFNDSLKEGLCRKPSGEFMRKMGEALDATYPAGREIKASLLRRPDTPLPEEKKIPLDEAKKGRVPGYYRRKFSQAALDKGLDEAWLEATLEYFSRILGYDDSKADLELTRLLEFIDVYGTFTERGDVRSMIYFRNRSAMCGDDNAQFNLLASLVDGSFGDTAGDPYVFFLKWLETGKTTWKENDRLIMTNKEEKLMEEIGKKQKRYGADAKFMLVCAYNSFKAGANLQYPVHKDLTGYLVGDRWNTSELKKDWDGIYLETPTNYMTVGDETEYDYESGLRLVMTRLGRLRWEHKTFDDECKHWLHLAVANPQSFRMGGPNMGWGLKEDKRRSMKRDIMQALGRADRTKVKNRTTLVLAEQSVAEIAYDDEDDSLTIPEYRALFKVCKEFTDSAPSTSGPDRDRFYVELARESQAMIMHTLRFSLSCYPKTDEDGGGWEDGPDRYVVDEQERLVALRRFFVRHITAGEEDLDRHGRLLPGIRRFYGEWPRGEDGSVSCSVDQDGMASPPSGKTGKPRKLVVSDGSLRLDVMRRNSVMRDYFTGNGIALTIKGEGLVLHPPVLASLVSGELGEMAVRAVIEWMISGKDNRYGLPKDAGYRVECPTGRDFEVCDMVVYRPDGTFLPIDAKNLNPDCGDFVRSYMDRAVGDNRAAKARRLGAEIITVNVVRLNKGACDIREIGGLVDRNGDWVPESLTRLRDLIIGKDNNITVQE